MPTGTRQVKIALVGPVQPYRGGISQYTTELHRALRTKIAGPTISFKRQYPAFLYPGDSDLLGDDMPFDEKGVDYVLDIYNPFTWRKAADQVIASGSQLVLLNWWTLIWQPATAYMARRMRRKGVKVAYICHNVVDHGATGLTGVINRLLSPFSRWWLKQADAYVALSSEVVRTLNALNPRAEVLLRLHPIHDNFPSPTASWSKRGRLDLLFFGFIRPYKGLDTLIEALRLLNDKNMFVTIAGEAWGDVHALRKQLDAAGVPNLELALGYQSDEDAANYITRADAVVLPYRTATGSGVVALAYHYGTPVIATKVGGLIDAVKAGETGFLVTPDSPRELADTIANTTRESLKAMEPAIEAFCLENTWDELVGALQKLA